MTNEKSEPTRNSREDQSPKEKVNGPSGLERLAELTRKLVRVPKEEVVEKEGKAGED